MEHDRSTAPLRRLGLLGLALCAALALAYAPRIEAGLALRAQQQQWGLAEGVVPANRDAFYAFRAAREIRAGAWREGERDALRRHPGGQLRGRPPWIGRVLARAADWSGGDVYAAGVAFSLVSSCLFVLPAFLFGVRVGMPAAGLLAGLVGSASRAVTERSSAYWVDTDGVNLFALWWIAWASLLPRAGRGRVAPAAGAVFAGLSVALFVAWYDKPGFVFVLLGAFALRVAAAGFGWRRAALLVALFALFANPLRIADAGPHLGRVIDEYAPRVLAAFSGDAPAPDAAPAARAASAPARDRSPLYGEGLGFVIAELQPAGPGAALAKTLRPAWLAALGLLGFALWCVRAWRVALPLAPMALLGLVGLVASQRMLLFLAPLVGFGLGCWIDLALRRAARSGRVRWPEPLAALAALALGAGVVGLADPSRVSRPQIDPRLLASLQRAARGLPPGGSVWSPFGMGFVIQDVMRAATFSDSVPDPVRSHVYLKGLVGTDPVQLQRVIAYLERTPAGEVTDAFRRDYAAAWRELAAGSGGITSAPHVLLTGRSLRTFPTMYRQGGWTPETGWPAEHGVEVRRCRDVSEARIECVHPDTGVAAEVDLRSGRDARGRAFDRVLFTERGFLRGERIFERSSGWSLILERSVEGIFASAAANDVIASNLVKLFLLGSADPRRFELVHDDFPLARLYRVHGEP